jgi:hypothetical protein
MKKYLAIFTGSMSSPGAKKWDTMDEASRKKAQNDGMKGWGEWIEKNKSSIVEIGAPLGKTKKTDTNGVSDIKNQMSGFTIVQAETHEAAAKLFLNHPHFSIFPGDGVEIMECMPIPGM